MIYKTYDEFEEAEGFSPVSPEAYYAERAWNAALESQHAELAALKGGQEPVGRISAMGDGKQYASLDTQHMNSQALVGCNLYVAPPAQANWRDHSVNYAKGEKPPQTIETLQAAWDRDQELLFDQKAEISRLKETINQLRQGQHKQ